MSAAIQTSDIPPNQTLYVHNLNDRLRSAELKRLLYHLFSVYGNVIDIHSAKTTQLRGQAFIVYDSVASAARALRELHNFALVDKPLHIQFAKKKSDVVAKADGTFVARQKRKAGEEGTKEDAAAAAAAAVAAAKQKEKEREAKKQKQLQQQQQAAAAAAAEAAATADGMATETQNPVEPVEPNRILFIERLPDAANELMLAMLFQQYPGYKESRMVSGRPGIAFVEFDEEYQSGVAMEGLQNFKVTPTHFMKISYAKKG